VTGLDRIGIATQLRHTQPDQTDRRKTQVEVSKAKRHSSNTRTQWPRITSHMHTKFSAKLHTAQKHRCVSYIDEASRRKTQAR
jgi:hypothetical protein